MSEKSICEQSKIFIAAGHETSSSALTWTIYLLSLHPLIQSKLTNEILSASSQVSFPFSFFKYMIVNVTEG